MFSASLHRERETLGGRVSEFLEWLDGRGGQVQDRIVVQSSDNAYHCLSIVLFYVLP